MARRKRSSLAEDLIELVALLPWWAGLALALFSYVLLHQIAAKPVAVAQPGQMSAIVTQGLWRALASVGQYVLPVICLVAAGVSAWRRKMRRNLVADVAQRQAGDVLDGMSWREFEVLVGEGFRLQGYQVAETGGGGADGGVDLVLTRPGRNGGEKLLVQCKQWRALKVGVDVVRELYGVMAARGATGGFVVTSGRFTDEAVSFASGRNVVLLDGQKLVDLIREARAGSRPTQLPDAPTADSPMLASSEQVTYPFCAKPMVCRTAKRGAKLGVDFWGCTGFPACRGTRPIG